MNKLPMVSNKKAIKYDYFPTSWQAVIWRNYGYIPTDRIAKALKTTEEIINSEIKRLGLDSLDTNKMWEKRGYLTTIRENWHLCSYKQIMTLLNIDENKLSFILKEDDFMWVKLGEMKPDVTEPLYKPLTDKERKETEKIAELINTNKFNDLKDNAFDFIYDFKKPVEFDEVKETKTEHIRMVYPYFALYGDALIDESIDPLPDKILEEYSRVGINGIWIQMVLYQMVEFPFEPSISKGWEKRSATLNKLVARAKKYGIGIYPYLNEPRSMSDSFFEKYPEMRGEKEGDYYALCTSDKKVKEYLYGGVKKLFEMVPDLAGFFTITMSENLTNCYSRSYLAENNGGGQIECERCSKRYPWEVVAEVNNLMAKGAHDANPNAKVIVWTWGWPDIWAKKVVPLLNEGQILQATSEEAMDYCIGGVCGNVLDYTMSLCGPGKKAKSIWKKAKEHGHQVCAKVQINNTWEMAAVPYIPVFSKVEQHIKQLKNEGIQHLHAGWTLGGCPSPNLRLASWLMDDNGDLKMFLDDWLGCELSEGVYKAQEKLSNAFSHYPFHMNTLYFGPQNFGPMAPFFLKKTEYEASMIGFPYDDLEKWSAIYPEDVYEKEYQQLVSGWKEGLLDLLQYEGENLELDEMILMTKVVLCHYKSAYNHILFVKYRNMDLSLGEWEHKEMLTNIIDSEKNNVIKLIGYRLKDSRIGYESSNQYFYTIQDLKEKIINLQHCKDVIEA